jgi:dihydrodipicolinate synthase/N-acetylneuraminate lyase
LTLELICRTATTFRVDGTLDEDAFRHYLQRFADAKLGVYLASGGSGESHAMSMDELRQLYRVGVGALRGKVPVYANPPEQHTVGDVLAQTQLAIECGCELVNIYGPEARHGYKPTDDEFVAYHDALLPQIRYPVALAPNPILGYSPKAQLVASIANRFPQVVAVNLALQTDDYLVPLLDALTREIAVYVPVAGSLNSLLLGAKGLLGAEANILPRTHRAYMDAYVAQDQAAMRLAYAEMKRFTLFVSGWGVSPRWLKAAMRVLHLPGGEGAPRGPFQLLSGADMTRFADGLLRLDIREIAEQARAAGVS